MNLLTPGLPPVILFVMTDICSLMVDTQPEMFYSNTKNERKNNEIKHGDTYSPLDFACQ